MNLKGRTKNILCFMVVMAAAVSLTGCASGAKKGMDAEESAEVAEMIDLVYYEYSAGTNMMAGDCNYETLRQDTDGRWVIISFKRDGVSEPTVVTTYAVEKDDLIRFDAFLKERNIVSLEDREDSGAFMTDYNPWSYSIRIKDPETGGTSVHTLEEYRLYSQDDIATINEMNQLFAEIHGKVLSTETKER